MIHEERRALLGDAVIAQIHERVAAAPEPSPEVIDKLRRILTRPAGRITGSGPAADAQPLAANVRRRGALKVRDQQI
ncbi:hypothetical protein [Streptomyces mirabilis]|uniref:hypothetical protein n=1 Tax=Streptomyces mirabilis TaxID=68239 RepID=UPI0036B79EE4